VLSLAMGRFQERGRTVTVTVTEAETETGSETEPETETGTVQQGTKVTDLPRHMGYMLRTVILGGWKLG
jgi:hypothetical protein